MCFSCFIRAHYKKPGQIEKESAEQKLATFRERRGDGVSTGLGGRWSAEQAQAPATTCSRRRSCSCSISTRSGSPGGREAATCARRDLGRMCMHRREFRGAPLLKGETSGCRETDVSQRPNGCPHATCVSTRTVGPEARNAIDPNPLAIPACFRAPELFHLCMDSLHVLHIA